MATAAGRLEESLALFAALGLKQGIAVALHGLGLAAWRRGDAPQAGARLRESLIVRHEMGDRLGIVESLEGLAVVVAEPQPVCAARLMGAATALRDAIDAPLPPVEQPDYERVMQAIRAALGEPALASAWATGRALSPEQAVGDDNVLLARVPAVAVDEPTVARHGLTPREVEVLRLLAGGATDREIAADLSISVKTINKHVASILGKTGSANRTAAAAFAHHHGVG